MLNRLKAGIINLGLKFMSVDEKIVRMILETAPSNVNEIVILPAIKLVTKKLINRLQNKRVHGRVYNGLLNGVNVSVIRSLVGCPNAANAIESLRRCNAKIIIRVDFCGGIGIEDNAIEIGDILIPKLAYCGDGTSPQYIMKYYDSLNQLDKINNPISILRDIQAGNQSVYVTKPNEKLKNLLLEMGKTKFSNSVKEVDFWTTDALFCETPEFVTALKSISVQGIDMESSVLFLLGNLFKIKTASILSVSDLPGHPNHDLFNSNQIHPEMENGINKAIKILIDSLPKIKALLKD